jgi:hypothetical protein
MSENGAQFQNGQMDIVMMHLLTWHINMAVNEARAEKLTLENQ